MFWFIALVVLAVVAAAFVAMAILGLALHALFSPWLLLLAVVVVLWLTLRARRSRR